MTFVRIATSLCMTLCIAVRGAENNTCCQLDEYTCYGILHSFLSSLTRVPSYGPFLAVVPIFWSALEGTGKVGIGCNLLILSVVHLSDKYIAHEPAPSRYNQKVQ